MVLGEIFWYIVAVLIVVAVWRESVYVSRRADQELHRDERLKHIVEQEIRKASDAQRIMSEDERELHALAMEQIATAD
ncbi:hypothetical protein MMC17_009884 [Xylographa soralifera]|nr:hypothetical protein [Xylographa soralifera]